MPTASDLRQRARYNMQGNTGNLILGALVYMLMTGVTSFLAIIFGGPLNVGYYKFVANSSRGRSRGLDELFDGFQNFLETMLLYILNGIFIFLWSLLLIIPGIIKGFSYSMSYLIMADNPGISQADARERSVQMMQRNKWRLFCLQLSFIGWMLLGILTFGILYIWLIPYMTMAEVEFYKNLIGDTRTARNNNYNNNNYNSNYNNNYNTYSDNNNSNYNNDYAGGVDDERRNNSGGFTDYR